MARVSAQSAVRKHDLPALIADIKATGQLARQALADPMPACADPGGYWKELLDELEASGGSVRLSDSLSNVLLAVAPTRNIDTLQAKLAAELKANVSETFTFEP